jgi:putative addiction module CopG family antidote
MSYQLPPDVEKLVREQLVAGGYVSADDVLRDALRVFGELKARHDQILADVNIGIAQAEQGLARPLDVNALIDRCTQTLAHEGIGD